MRTSRKLFNAKRTNSNLFVIFGLVLLSATLTGCEYKWLATKSDGSPILRQTCRTRYLINIDALPDRGVSRYGFDVVTLFIERVNHLTATTGVTWQHDGYTSHDYDDAGPGRQYALSTGVIVEFRPFTRAFGWSQPLPTTGPSYQGGVMWFDMNGFWMPGMTRADVARFFDHEIGHQFGLADIQNVNERMGHTAPLPSGQEWGPGDREGLRIAANAQKASC